MGGRRAQQICARPFYMILLCIIFAPLGAVLLLSLLTRKFRNPYRLYMVFGKKGSGKSTYLIKKGLAYQKKGYVVYTNMLDCMVPGFRIFDAEDLGQYVPCQNSVMLLDEVGMIYDNRQFKSFKPETRDFYKYQRHYRCIVYLASQSFDIDKKLRDLTDKMFLVTSFFNVFSLVRPINKKITLTQSTSEAESRIADDLKFTWLPSWRLTYIPKYKKYFDSFDAPIKPEINYHTNMSSTPTGDTLAP